MTLNREPLLSLFQQRLSLLSRANNHRLLAGIARGIEKESLRVTADGKLARTPHPAALGSALTHPQITTDYSEALLEFITPPDSSISQVLETMENIHRYTYRQIGDERLWVDSMPCVLGSDADIPVAQYGHSNIAQMKTNYRVGLGHRYGRLMQTIAGIHYNFSVPENFWTLLHQQEAPQMSLQDFKTDRYFGLIRNFRRYFWLLLYLFGAAPAVCSSFVRNREHSLVPIDADRHSLHTPYATSLRMGNLGYQSKAQEQLVVCYNNLSNYVSTLKDALLEPYPAYEAIGIKNPQGQYRQLNNHLLQIENEFYSSIRPKRIAQPGETPLSALQQRGVEYIEVRCVDLNPYLCVGIDEQQIRFLDTFLLYCLLADSPETDNREYRNTLENQHRMVYRGRDSSLTLMDGNAERSIAEWGKALFDELHPVAAMLDSSHQGTDYLDTLSSLTELLGNPEQTPSARILQEIRDTGQPYFHVALGHANKHREYFLDTPLAPEIEEQYAELAAVSLQQQRDLEASDTKSFDDFLADYYQQYDSLS